MTGQPEDVAPGDAAAAFDFARQVRQEEFRRYLKLCGHTSGLPVICLREGVPWDADRRLADAQATEALIARQDPSAPCGWRIRRHRTGECKLVAPAGSEDTCACEIWESCIRDIVIEER